jgi:hypothetical protein
MDCLAAKDSDSTPQTHADCPEDSLAAPSVATPSTGTPSHSSSLIYENHQSKKKFKLSRYDIRQQPASTTRTLVLSIMLRTAFGGMACDVVMLKKYTSLWYNRFFPDRGDADRAIPPAVPTPVSSDAKASFLSLSSDKSSDNIASEMTSSPSSTPIPPSSSACQQLSVFPPAAGHELSLQRDMTVYMHHRWTDSDLSGKSPWVMRCVESFSSLPIKISAADSDMDCSAAAAGPGPPLPEALESLTFSTLRRYISSSLRDGGCTPLSLYAPDQAALAAPGAACPASRKLLQQHLLLRTLDLVPEGIDFHCDSEIIRAVRDRYCTRSVQLFMLRTLRQCS